MASVTNTEENVFDVDLDREDEVVTLATADTYVDKNIVFNIGIEKRLKDIVFSALVNENKNLLSNPINTENQTVSGNTLTYEGRGWYHLEGKNTDVTGYRYLYFYQPINLEAGVVYDLLAYSTGNARNMNNAICLNRMNADGNWSGYYTAGVFNEADTYMNGKRTFTPGTDVTVYPCIHIKGTDHSSYDSSIYTNGSIKLIIQKHTEGEEYHDGIDDVKAILRELINQETDIENSPTDEHINDLIDAKLGDVETLLDEIIGGES